MNSAGSKTILLVDAGYFLTREIASAIQQEGHKLVVVTLSIPTDIAHEDASPYEMFLDMIIKVVEQHHPDLLITINHLGHDKNGRLNDLLEALELPSLVWYVDSPRYIFQNSLENVSEQTGIFLWDDSYTDYMKSLGFSKIRRLPLATESAIFERGEIPAGSCEKAPLVFVGDSMANAVEKAIASLPENLRPDLSDLSAGIFSKLAQQFLELVIDKPNAKQPAWEVLKPIRESVKSNLTDSSWSQVLSNGTKYDNADWLLVESALVLFATKALRSQILQGVSQLPAAQPLTVYGDEGWKAVLNGTTKLFPSVDYYRQLADVYRQAGAVFNITGIQMPRGLNQRCFDVPAAGGLLLTDNQADASEYFIPGEEIETFSTIEEMNEKWKYYKNNLNARNKIIANGRKRVLSHHTYRHRLAEMLKAAKSWNLI